MALKKFPNIRRFAWESTKTEKWNTTIQRTASGRLRTMTNQLYPAWTIEASYNVITDEEARQLLGFVASLKGSSEPFLWLDPEDYEEKGQQLVQIDGVSYQAVMRQGDHLEPVEYIEDVKVYIDGILQGSGTYTVAAGIVKFKTTPAGIVTADYTYYWKVILSGDQLKIEKIFKDANKASITMEVAR